MNRLIVCLREIIQNHRYMMRWKRIATALAAVCVFVTTYALILPAITIEKDNTDEVSGLYLDAAETPDTAEKPDAAETPDSIKAPEDYRDDFSTTNTTELRSIGEPMRSL